MKLLDHVLVFIIAVVYPISGFIGFRRLLRRVAAGESVSRLDLYRNTLIGHWALFSILVALWSAGSRDWALLGFRVEADQWSAVAAVLGALSIYALFRQVRQVQAASREEIKRLARRFGRLSLIIPHNDAELSRFYMLSVTAGIVEEVLWRGFVIWYLNQYFSLLEAALISTVGFVLAHAYQGLVNLPQITAVSFVFVALYLLSGSIWLPIALHAAVDIMQGRLGYDVMTRNDNKEQL